MEVVPKDAVAAPWKPTPLADISVEQKVAVFDALYVKVHGFIADLEADRELDDNVQGRIYTDVVEGVAGPGVWQHISDVWENHVDYEGHYVRL